MKLKDVDIDYYLTMMILEFLNCMWSCNEFHYVVHKVCWVKCEVCVLDMLCFYENMCSVNEGCMYVYLVSLR